MIYKSESCIYLYVCVKDISHNRRYIHHIITIIHHIITIFACIDKICITKNVFYV